MCHGSLPAVKAVSHFAMTREHPHAIANYSRVNMSLKQHLYM
ncbi:hypothetical protein BACPLE_03510 [Phocaeicola plebeius DSM 17135]|uniref:Uncharacterized protein n=1 Tax=Phocaeicola plebeius (strain DSM 17135 / JCM 12973 / CCUG 54634 / M2) TaxID=484018 RepID=B5D3B6_PHOPM|nr:hypothetical protein BACPLE_03510 [Phocaeicola plebeius DSM 17135]